MGMGEKGRLEQRVAKIERFIERFERTRIQAKSSTGKWGNYHVLAHPAGPADEEEVGQFIVTLKRSGAGWVAKVSVGYVLVLDPKAGASPVAKYWTPDGLDADPAPEFSVSASNALFVRVQTDKRGIPTAVTMAVSAPNTASTHYQPDPETGVNGDYFYKIAEFETVGDRLTVKPFQTGGPIHHLPQLWTGENIGGGSYPIFKQRDPGSDKYQFRKIEQLGGGEAILKPLDGAIGNEIQVRGLAAGAKGQIQIEADGDVLRAKGNDLDKYYDLGFGGFLNFVDGLLASAGDISGSDFNIECYLVNLYILGGELMTEQESSPFLTFYVRKGRISDGDPGGDPVPVYSLRLVGDGA